MIEAEEMQRRIDMDAMEYMAFISALVEDSKTIEIIKIRKWDPVAFRWYYDEFYNVPVSFDIETTGDAETKTSYMYHWQLNFNGFTVCGRTWQQYFYIINIIKSIFNLNPHKRIIIYIHNFAYEFSFMGPRLHIADIFATDERKPLYVITDEGIEYRDSYILAGKSLAAVGKELTKIKIRKMSGDLDYNIPRNSKTVLTRKELIYCWNDVKVLTAYIFEQIEQYGNITKIPLTNTGRVRDYIRQNCIKPEGKKDPDYIDMMQRLTITPEEYQALKAAYQGGFTHAGHFHVGEVCRRVYSVDFTSSYPAVECADYFPMTKGEAVEYKNVREYFEDCARYCVVALIEFKNLRSVFPYEHYITSSKGIPGSMAGLMVDNGRIISADKIAMWLTEIDMQIIAKTYSSDITVLKAYRYKRGRLPKAIIESVLLLYADKTTLKDVEGSEADYAMKKSMLNSNYGMMVTDITNPEIYYNSRNAKPWATLECDYDTEIEKYNSSKKRFLSYAWGIYVTAHARARLWRGIMECGPDYIYSDTDSIKFFNYDRHAAWFGKYNSEVQNDIKAACQEYGIDPSKANPVTCKGEHKPLGVWDFEGYYDKFKTLGAKRYIIKGVRRPDGSMKKDHMITIAGLSKSVGGDYIFNQKRPFQFFNDGMIIPAEYSGRTVSYYHDEPAKAWIVDNQGNQELMEEKACVYIGGSEYNMNILHSYIEYIKQGRMDYVDLKKETEGMRAYDKEKNKT